LSTHAVTHHLHISSNGSVASVCVCAMLVHATYLEHAHSCHSSVCNVHYLRYLYAMQVYAMYIGLLLSALNKLPLKLPGNSAGRRHVQKSSTSEPVTFDDVAGVDEAKEELAEVVVCPLLGAVVVSSWLTRHYACHWPSQLDVAARHEAFLCRG